MKSAQKILFLFISLSFILFVKGDLIASENKSPIGLWKTIDDSTKTAKSIVEIYEKNGVYYAKIVKLLTKPQTELCPACTGARKNKPLVGMTFLWGMKKDGDEYSGGQILDPENGKNYDCKFWVENNRLKVRGYIAFFFRTQYWYRVKK